MEDRWQVLPVALYAFETVRATAVARAGNSPRVRQALVACDEWIANVVAYSGATLMDFCCEADEGCIIMTFSDDGIPFDPTSESDDPVDFDALDQGGMGLSLIRQSALRMEYARQRDRNVLKLWFALEGGTLNSSEGSTT